MFGGPPFLGTSTVLAIDRDLIQTFMIVKRRRAEIILRDELTQLAAPRPARSTAH
jgi:hypothetical protein